VYTSDSYENRPLVGERPTLLTRPLCLGTGWYSSLPLPWYLEKVDADTSCQQDPAALSETVASTPPPLIITNTGDETVPKEALRSEYTPQTYEWFKYGHQVTFWLRDDQVSEVPGWAADG
jgi:predicted membrane-bound mannosyltransferase